MYFVVAGDFMIFERQKVAVDRLLLVETAETFNRTMIIAPKNQPKPPPPCQVRFEEMEMVQDEDVEINRKEFSDFSCRDILSLVTDCWEEEDHLTEDMDNISTRAHIDTDELPLLSRIRIFLQEKRDSIFPFILIISGTFTSLISVSWPRYQNVSEFL